MNKNKIALITGGSRGIGYGIARCLAQEGWDLAINGIRDRAAVEKELATLESGGNQIIYCQGDIGNSEDRKWIIDQVMNHFGRLNVLVNNAGIAPTKRMDLLEMTEESYNRVMDVNLKGTFFLSQLAAREMIDMKNKEPDSMTAIINISSISATHASVSRGEYCISKAGLGMVTKLLASRLGEKNIPVYEIRPGIIETDMTAAVKEKYDDLFQKGLNIQARWGQAEEVGKAVASLVRGDFPYSTGQVIMVDGGLSIDRL